MKLRTINPATPIGKLIGGLSNKAVLLSLMALSACTLDSPDAIELAVEPAIEQNTLKTRGEDAWNFERVGTGLTADGSVDLGAYAKLGPWPNPDGDILYSGCYDPSTLTPEILGSDRCFATVDLSDPANPVRMATVYTYDRENSPSPPRGHIVWSNDYAFPNLPTQSPCMVDWQDPEIALGTKAPACWDPGWNTHSHYVQKGPGDIVGVNQEHYRAGTRRQEGNHGVKLYDVSDPANPKYLSYWAAPVSPPNSETGRYPDNGGVHHFNFMGDYLYVGSEYEGFIGKIFVIVDVSDPMNPVETGKWWIPGQRTPEEDSIRDWEQQPIFINPVVKNEQDKWTKHVGMHYVSLDEAGERAYLSYHQSGLIIMDISDKTDPKLISQMDYMLPGADPTNPDIDACIRAAGGQPAGCGNAHSAKLIPGREDLLIMSDEYFTCPYGHVRMFDISDETNPKIISHFLTDLNMACDEENPKQPSDPSQYRIVVTSQPLVIGASSHIGNAWGPDLYFMAWYGGGLRAIDISDPTNLKEVGHYRYSIDKDLDVEQPGYTGSHTYDVLIGEEGYLYVADASAGLRVLKYTGPLRPE